MKKLLSSAIATVIACSIVVPAFAESQMHGNDDKDEVKVEAHVRGEAHMSMKKQPTAADLLCMQTAIEKRENALIAAVSANNTAWMASLTTRRDELVAAWKLTDNKARREGVKNAWKKFRDARKSQREALRTARKNAWSQFKTDAKACNVENTESGAEGIDSQN